MPVTGTLVGNLTWIDRPGVQSWAVLFPTPADRTNYVDLGSADFVSTRAFTVFFSLKVDTIDSDYQEDGFILLFKGDDPPISANWDHSGNEVVFEVIPGEIYGTFDLAVAIGGLATRARPPLPPISIPGYIGRRTVDGVLPVDVWHTLAITYNGSTKSSGIKIYRNGYRVDTKDYNTITTMKSRKRSSNSLKILGDGYSNA